MSHSKVLKVFQHKNGKAIFLSDVQIAQNSELLQQEGISHVLSCLSGANDTAFLLQLYTACNIKHQVIPVLDMEKENFLQYFEKGTLFIHEALTAHDSNNSPTAGGILVHW